MARPVKDNADYFSHDADMRDDPKIKALRRKFKVEGYGIWCMLLESITDADNFRLFMDYEIIAGDYDIDPTKLKEIVDYCINLGLLQFDQDKSILWSKTLDNRFGGLLSKRKRERNPADGELSSTINPQSKVKYSKGDIDIIGDGKFSISIRKVFANDKIIIIHDLRLWFERQSMLVNLEEKGWVHFHDFLEANPGRTFNDPDHVYSSFKNFCTTYKPPDLKPAEFEIAEYNKSQWTIEAWEQQYKKQITFNPKFRKHFGYGELQESKNVGNNGKPG